MCVTYIIVCMCVILKFHKYSLKLLRCVIEEFLCIQNLPLDISCSNGWDDIKMKQIASSLLANTKPTK